MSLEKVLLPVRSHQCSVFRPSSVTIVQRCKYLTPSVNIVLKMTKCADFAMYQPLRLSVDSVAILQTADVTCLSTHTGCRSSSVGTATRYGMDGPGFESRWGGIFPIRSHRPWGPPSLLHGVSFPMAKRPSRGVDHPPPTSAEVKERVKLYLYSLCALAARYRESLPFPSTRIHYRMLGKACGNGRVKLLQTSQHYTDICIRLCV